MIFAVTCVQVTMKNFQNQQKSENLTMISKHLYLFKKGCTFICTGSLINTRTKIVSLRNNNWYLTQPFYFLIVVHSSVFEICYLPLIDNEKHLPLIVCVMRIFFVWSAHWLFPLIMNNTNVKYTYVCSNVISPFTISHITSLWLK